MEGNTMCELRQCRLYHHHHQQQHHQYQHHHHHHVSSSSSSSWRRGRYRWWWWWGWCWRVVVVYFILLTSCADASANAGNADREKMYVEPLEGVAKIQVLVCFTDANAQDIISVKIFDPRNDSTSLVFVNLRSKQCLASATFSSCEIATVRGQTVLKAIIIDLEEGETRTYGCEVLRLTSSKPVPKVYYVNLAYTGPTTTVTITSTTTAASTMKAGSSLEAPNADAGFQMPDSVVFVVLGLLVFFITLCCVLGIHYYRGRRRKRKSRDCDAMSVRSGVTDKDFYTVGFNPNGGTGDLGMRGPQPPRGGGGEGGFVRQFSISSASGLPSSGPNNVEVPGSLAQRLVMQYQKPQDTVIVPAEVSTLNFSDRGYVSGSSVHYQEPWGRTLDDPEILGKLSTLRSPNRHLVRIPDFHASVSASTSTPTTTTTTADTTPSSPFPSAPPPPPAVSGDPPPSPPSLTSFPPTQESQPPFPAAPSCPSPSSSSSSSSPSAFPPPECHA